MPCWTYAQKHLFVGSDIRKSNPYRISYLRATGRKGFWATRSRPQAGRGFQKLNFLDRRFRVADNRYNRD